MTRAPRIDTLRNRLDATGTLLETVTSELDDLHALAYERATAARDIAVAGGTRDYALDTHGDPAARAAYRTLGDAAITACEILAEAAHDAVAVLRQGPPLDRRQPARRIQAEEHAEALEAQARRIARGDYTPVRALPQPEAGTVEHTIRRLIHERDEALRRADRYARRLAVHEPPEPASRRRRRRRRSTA